MGFPANLLVNIPAPALLRDCSACPAYPDPYRSDDLAWTVLAALDTLCIQWKDWP